MSYFDLLDQYTKGKIYDYVYRSQFTDVMEQLRYQLRHLRKASGTFLTERVYRRRRDIAVRMLMIDYYHSYRCQRFNYQTMTRFMNLKETPDVMTDLHRQWLLEELHDLDPIE